MEADTIGFKVGDSFNTSSEEAALERFKSTKFADCWRRDSRTIEATCRRGITRPLKVELRYHEIKYCCIHGGQVQRQRQ